MGIVAQTVPGQAATALELFGLLYGEEAPGWLTIWARQDKRTRYFPAGRLDLAAREALKLSRRGLDVYFGVGLRRENLGEKRRGEAEDVCAIPALWVDVDVAGPAHSDRPYPPTMEAALSLLNDFPLPPSILVDSGHGLHGYWLLRELWTFDSKEEWQAAKDLLARFQATIRARAEQRGWHLDTTADLARVLRVAGATNYKLRQQPVPVRVLEAHPDRRYNPSDFEPYLVGTTPAVFVGSGNKSRSDPIPESSADSDSPPARIEPILARCPWVKHCVDDAATLPEPEWYAMLGVVGRCENGEELAHRFSAPYPRYRPEETQAKLEHAMRDAGPVTCERVEREFGSWCRSCAYRGRVKSPIVLGMRRPTPLLLPVDPFPIETLPGVLARFVEEGARAFKCPPDYLALPALVLAGAAIGSTRVLQLKPGWWEGCRFYAVIVGDPGQKKSPVLAAVAEPFHRRQQVLAAEHEEAKRRYYQERAKYEVELARWEEATRTAAKRGGPDPGDKPEEPRPPVMESCYTTNVTVEALAGLLRDNFRGLALLPDEATAWVRALNQYKAGGKGADRDFYLSLWSGKPIKVDRRSLREPIFVSHPCASLVGAVPPDLLGELTDEEGREDGFIHRVLFVYPDPVPGGWTEDTISPQTREAYLRLFESLWKLAPAVNDAGQPEPLAVTFTPGGKDAWVRWDNEHHQEMNAPGFPEQLKGPWAKLEAYCARFALVIQVVRHATGEADSEQVDALSVASAAALVEYLKAHTRRVYRRLRATKEDKLAAAIVEWAQGKRLTRVTARQLYTDEVAGIRTPSEAEAALRLLEDRGYGFVEKVKPERGRPSVVFTFFTM